MKLDFNTTKTSVYGSYMEVEVRSAEDSTEGVSLHWRADGGCSFCSRTWVYDAAQWSTTKLCDVNTLPRPGPEDQEGAIKAIKVALRMLARSLLEGYPEEADEGWLRSKFGATDSVYQGWYPSGVDKDRFEDIVKKGWAEVCEDRGPIQDTPYRLTPLGLQICKGGGAPK